MHAEISTTVSPLTWGQRFALWARLLTFRSEPSDWDSFDKKLLLAGLLCTWVVGIGRFWDTPAAQKHLLQSLGFGSVIYVFVLALLLWCITKPIKPKRFSYVKILTFVCLTSPPALLYAIPVEKCVSMKAATEANLYFLGVVAIWRMALYVFFLVKAGNLRWIATTACALTPVSLILIALTFLNLNRVVLNIMAGLQEDNVQASAYLITNILAVLSVPVSVLAGILWLYCWWKESRNSR